MLTEDQANQIYEILERVGGALPSERDHFVFQQTSRDIEEWRFCGHFGFGGKFWSANGKWYVTMYDEDRTPSLDRVRDAINELLADLLSAWGSVL